MRRRFCNQQWRFAWNGIVLTGASSVTRYPLLLPRGRHPIPRSPGTGSYNL